MKRYSFLKIGRSGDPRDVGVLALCAVSAAREIPHSVLMRGAGVNATAPPPSSPAPVFTPGEHQRVREEKNQASVTEYVPMEPLQHLDGSFEAWADFLSYLVCSRVYLMFTLAVGDVRRNQLMLNQWKGRSKRTVRISRESCRIAKIRGCITDADRHLFLPCTFRSLGLRDHGCGCHWAVGDPVKQNNSLWSYECLLLDWAAPRCFSIPASRAPR